MQSFAVKTLFRPNPTHFGTCMDVTNDMNFGQGLVAPVFKTFHSVNMDHREVKDCAMPEEVGLYSTMQITNCNESIVPAV